MHPMAQSKQPRPLIDPRIRALHLGLERRHPRSLEMEASVARASVALLIRPVPSDLEVLLIERSVSADDPWSGHMALPGGRRERDEEALDTVIRETQEEIGLDLAREGMLIGQLDELLPSGGPRIAVAPFVFAVPEAAQLSPDPAEVAHVVWIPLAHLSDPAAAAEHLHIVPGGDPHRFPALAYRRHVIWGLTYRMLMQFLGVARAVFQEPDR